MAGYCTVPDVERAMQRNGWNNALDPANTDTITQTIEGLRDPIEKATYRHWYDKSGSVTSPQSVIATSNESRSDEYSFTTHGGYVEGAYDTGARAGRNADSFLGVSHTIGAQSKARTDLKREIEVAAGEDHALTPPIESNPTPAYAKIDLTRKDVQSINKLEIVDKDNSLVDWVASNDYEGGVGKSNRGKDYWVQVNSGGDSRLYVDIHALDDEIATLSNALYIDIDYGKTTVPEDIRRGTANLVASELVHDEEFRQSIPDDGQLTDVETKYERFRAIGMEKLRPHIEWPEVLEE